MTGTIPNRRRFLKAAGAATTGLLAGCTGGPGSGGTSSGGNSSKTIRYLSDRGGAKSTISNIVKSFESEHDYTVDVSYTPRGTSLDEELKKMQAAGNTPDLIFRGSVDGYRHAYEGDLAPITDVMKDLNVPDPVQLDGESYFAGALIEPVMLWYRTDIIDEPPTTWSGWQKEAQRISQEEDMNGYVIGAGATNFADFQAREHFWTGGVDLYDGPTGDVSVAVDKGDSRKAAVKAYEWIKAMNEYSPNATNWAWDESSNALMQGNTAALASLSGLPILSVLANRPELADKLSATLVPLRDGQSRDRWVSSIEGHVVMKDGGATDGAREFLRFFNQSDSFMDFVTSAPLFQWPANKAELDSDAIQKHKDYSKFPSAINLLKDNWDTMQTMYNTADNSSPNIIGSRCYDQQILGQSVEQMLVANKSPDATVDWLASELRKLKDE